MMRRDGAPILIAGEGRVCALDRVALASDAAGTGYDEAWLQRLIHQAPACLPIAEIEPGFDEPISVCMELPTAHGPIDNLLMTADGDLVLVETKLWRNPEARRTVVAQALDYASCVFAMDYQALEHASLKADHGARPKPTRLLDLFAETAIDEAQFVDAVNWNLRLGRAVVLVVGDGIRTEAEQLVGLLQSHAGSRFTFALVELAIHQIPGDGLLVLPRTLAQTTMIERGVVDVRDERVVVKPAPAKLSSAARPASITSEKFYEAMAERGADVPTRLGTFLERLEPLGVYPEFRRTLILRWEPPSGKPANLGYIQLDGHVWTDAVNRTTPHDLSHRYIEELAEALGSEVDRTSLGENWHVRINGKPPRIEQIADRLNAWVPVIERFLARLRERLAHEPNA